MPRKKLTPEEIQARGKELHARMVYMAAHPEEKRKAEAQLRARLKQKTAKNMAKHLPEATDISSNGKYVHVAFTRNNGERVIGVYRHIGWDYAPATERGSRPPA
jgi:hypothetical protein